MTSAIWTQLLPNVLVLITILLFWSVHAYRTKSRSSLVLGSPKTWLSTKGKKRCAYCLTLRPAFGHDCLPPPPPPLSTNVPPPPLSANIPPPPPPFDFISQRKILSAMTVREELSALYSNEIKLNEDGHVELTSLQYLLFKDRTGTSSNDSIHYVSLLEYAGSVSLWIYQDDILMKQLATSLLPRLQAVAAPAQKMSMERYRAEQLVKLLNHEIICSANGKRTTGIFEGAAYISDLPSGSERLKLRIHGRDMWEVLVDVSSLSDGSSKISALNQEDGEADEFELLMLET